MLTRIFPTKVLKTTHRNGRGSEHIFNKFNESKHAVGFGRKVHRLHWIIDVGITFHELGQGIEKPIEGGPQHWLIHLWNVGRDTRTNASPNWTYHVFVMVSLTEPFTTYHNLNWEYASNWAQSKRNGLVLRKISDIALTSLLATKNRVHETTLAQQLLIRIGWIWPGVRKAPKNYVLHKQNKFH